MAVDTDAVLDQQYSRMIDRQRAQVETAKLLTTFAAAIAATLVASALQVVRGSGQTRWSSCLLAACFVAAILVIVFDRISEPDLDPAVIQTFGDHARFQEYVNTQLIAAQKFNESVVRAVRIVVAIQLAFAAASGAIATMSLLAGLEVGSDGG